MSRSSLCFAILGAACLTACLPATGADDDPHNGFEPFDPRDSADDAAIDERAGDDAQDTEPADDIAPEDSEDEASDPSTPDIPDVEPDPAALDAFCDPRGRSPATTFCGAEGFEVIDGACVFPDDSSCPEWDFLRGACGTEWTSCTRSGFEADRRTFVIDGTQVELGACIFGDGTFCSYQDWLCGTCGFAP